MPVTIAKLVATGNHATGREIVLTAFPVRLGRRVGSGIHLDDRWVSRDHCEITRETDDGLIVRDLGSKHGTYVNGQEVDVAQLHPGDELSVGLTRFVVQYVGDPSGTAAMTRHTAV